MYFVQHTSMATNQISAHWPTPQSHKYRKLNALNFISCLKFISRNTDGKVLQGSTVQKKPVPLTLHLFLNSLWNISQKYTSDDYCFISQVHFHV